MAIIDLVDKISNNIDIKKHSIEIFPDLSKAFDTIDHQILLRKLQRYVLNSVQFADDTSIFHAHTYFDTLIEEINEELQKITTWFHTNKLSLNIKQSNFIIFLPKGQQCNTENVKINIIGNEIKRVDFTNFFRNLHWWALELGST